MDLSHIENPKEIVVNKKNYNLKKEDGHGDL